MTEVSSTYWISAGWNGSGWIGKYSLPGKDTQHAPGLYDTADAAGAAAGVTLCDALNSRFRSTQKHGYRKFHGDWLAQKMAELDIGTGELARLIATTQSRVVDWLEGEREIPHQLYLLMNIIGETGTLERALEISEGTMIEEDDR